jgi:hypothetical protein
MKNAAHSAKKSIELPRYIGQEGEESHRSYQVFLTKKFSSPTKWLVIDQNPVLYLPIRNRSFSNSTGERIQAEEHNPKMIASMRHADPPALSRLDVLFLSRFAKGKTATQIVTMNPESKWVQKVIAIEMLQSDAQRRRLESTSSPNTFIAKKKTRGIQTNANVSGGLPLTFESIRWYPNRR